MDYVDFILYNITCVASLLALSVVLYVRIKLTICQFTIYEVIILRIIISDMIFEILNLLNSWWMLHKTNCYLFTTLNNIPLVYSILNSYLISYISW